jgi:hypothetical protein
MYIPNSFVHHPLGPKNMISVQKLPCKKDLTSPMIKKQSKNPLFKVSDI